MKLQTQRSWNFTPWLSSWCQQTLWPPTAKGDQKKPPGSCSWLSAKPTKDVYYRVHRSDMNLEFFFKKAATTGWYKKLFKYLLMQHSIYWVEGTYDSLQSILLEWICTPIMFHPILPAIWGVPLCFHELFWMGFQNWHPLLQHTKWPFRRASVMFQCEKTL